MYHLGYHTGQPPSFMLEPQVESATSITFQRFACASSTSKDVHWVTLAYIPQVETELLETREGHQVHFELFQRSLHLVCRRSALASHHGACLNKPGGGRVRVSPHFLHYVREQRGERTVLCLKGILCFSTCTPCKVGREVSCSVCEADAPGRDIQVTVRAQSKKVRMRVSWGAAAKRAEVELKYFLNSVVSAMAAWAGLGNRPRVLYKLPGLYRLNLRLLHLRGYNCLLFGCGGRVSAHVGRHFIGMLPRSCSVYVQYLNIHGP